MLGISFFYLHFHIVLVLERKKISSDETYLLILPLEKKLQGSVIVFESWLLGFEWIDSIL